MVLILFSYPFAAFAQDDSAFQEYRIKAEHVCGLARHVQWPPDAPAETVVIGVLGNSPISKHLAAIATARQIDGRRIVLHQFAPPARYKPCHILFLSGNLSREQQRQVIRTFGKQPILLVGESPGFASDGGMINLRSSEDGVALEINHAACRHAKLLLDARLLSLGTAVDP